jgi:hypothetical protein
MFLYIYIKTIILSYNNMRIILNTAVEPGHTLSEYARNVVAQGEMGHPAAGLSEPAG